MTDIEAMVHQMRADLDSLRERNARLESECSQLRAEVAGLRQGQASPSDDTTQAVVAGQARPMTRRGMFAVAAGAAGGLVLAQASPAAAATEVDGFGLIWGGNFGASSSTKAQFGVRGWVKCPTAFGVHGNNTSTSGSAIGVFGQTNGNNGRAVYGRADRPTGTTYGVYGKSVSTGGRGVYGLAAAGAGDTCGTRGDVASNAGTGVFGFAYASAGATFGVRGQSSSSSGTGVYGLAAASTGATYGVVGRAVSPQGFAVLANGRFKATGRSYLATPNSPPWSGELSNGSVSLYLDEANSTLNVMVKYSNGSLRSGKITLTS